ncbi:DNA repair protein RadC [Phocaeicola sartorii]|uniref:RadC family protein n=1 Tax=Phocaeicola sartorii TaxID=671267 RepID=UPI00258EC456|nr:DNA repair protein RadC [Phocaeicola sartorii]
MEAAKLNIKQWAEDDRPREKLMRKGAAMLSNAELLAILIGSGSSDESAVELMKRLLADCGNSLRNLGRMSLGELTGKVERTSRVTGMKKTVRRYKGLGEAKAVTLMAACELGRRRMGEDAVELPSIQSSVDLYRYFRPQMQDLFHEECYVVLMNQACRIMDRVLISKGGLTETSVDIRLILREALLSRAPVIALCHNHPSGQLRPSVEDDRITERLLKACRMMNIRLLDHIIVADGGFYSYCEEGKLV